MPYKNPYFFVTAAPNRFGFSLRFRSLVIIFIARKHISIYNFERLMVLMYVCFYSLNQKFLTFSFASFTFAL